MTEQEAPLEALSWVEARSRLRKVLEAYLKEPLPKPLTPACPSASASESSVLSNWIRYDLDLYAGSLLFSVALFVVSCLNWLARTNAIGNQVLQASAAVSVYTAQLVASLLILAGAALSLWMLRSRQNLWLHDSENAKRRIIRGYLRKLDRYKSSSMKSPESTEGAPELDKMNLQGTSLTDSYPAYRISSLHGKATASWSRIPSLLLVQGDLIALQIGDTAPANCRIAGKTAENTLRFQIGDTIKTDSADFPDLPVGRSTLPEKSEHFLSLCDNVRIFVVMESPLIEFLRKPAAVPRSSEASRQLLEIRKLLSVIALVCIMLTAVIAFARVGATDGNISLALPLPFLAALGVLPVVGPAFLFITEMLGTARILAVVHKYASLSADSDASGRTTTLLLFRYFVATALSRLSLWQTFIATSDVFCRCSPFQLDKENLLRIPPVSQCLLEKLGLATCFSIIDDQVACEPYAVPQQLLIPSARGLKLFDLCLTHDEDSDHGSDESVLSSSDSSENETRFLSLRRGAAFRRHRRRKIHSRVSVGSSEDLTESTGGSSFEVQFEDPAWWQYLPTLKCIGLASLVIDDKKDSLFHEGEEMLGRTTDHVTLARSSLVPYVCRERRSDQLRALAQCIGFSEEPNSFGDRGDLSWLSEKLRLKMLSTSIFKDRLMIDAHERSSEQSRWWGHIRPDATSVIIQDSRSQAYQVLTVGEPQVVVSLCHEAWQGEISTILPLTSEDRQTILETTNDWKLADLDVAAFAYSPIPRTLEKRLAGTGESHVHARSGLYLLDANIDGVSAQMNVKNKNNSPEWSLVKNQVFLGVLGSLVVPRGEIQKLLKTFSDAGVRFVYFSPRNMRRQKELAVQMGIDVAWNAAISLRPLESGEEDQHRMRSNYADWVTNAKLPHGVADVRKHLEEVDNVPLLVSLFTDVTKQTTRDMIEIFQDYSDTVIAVGSTMPWNGDIFSVSDIAIGVDTFNEGYQSTERPDAPLIRGSELELASALSAHSCAFRFRGPSSVSHLSEIIERGRAALGATTASCLFFVSGCLAFSFFTLLAACNPSTTIPFLPTLGAVIFLQIILPMTGFAMAMTDAESNAMKHVPPKNDQAVSFRRREGKILYAMLVAKALLPALLSSIMWLIAYGTLIFHFEHDLVARECPDVTNWPNVLRCSALKNYLGPASTSAGALALSHLILCVIVGSASFVYRTRLIIDQHPFDRNYLWLASCLVGVGLTGKFSLGKRATGSFADFLIIPLLALALYLALTVASESRRALPRYYYCLSFLNPFICLVWNECCKGMEAKTERRAEKLRRLQFETRLGAWSPK